MNTKANRSLLALAVFSLAWFFLFSYFFSWSIGNEKISKKPIRDYRFGNINKDLGHGDYLGSEDNYYDDYSEDDFEEIIIRAARIIKVEDGFVTYYQPESIIWSRGKEGEIQKILIEKGVNIMPGTIADISVSEKRVKYYYYKESLDVKEAIITKEPIFSPEGYVTLEVLAYEDSQSKEMVVWVPVDAIIEDYGRSIDYSHLKIDQRIEFLLDPYSFGQNKQNISMYIKVIK